MLGEPTIPSESQNCPAVLHTETLREQLSLTEEHINVVLTIPSGAVNIAVGGKANVLTLEFVKASLLIERVDAPQLNITDVK